MHLNSTPEICTRYTVKLDKLTESQGLLLSILSFHQNMSTSFEHKMWT